MADTYNVECTDTYGDKRDCQEALERAPAGVYSARYAKA